MKIKWIAFLIAIVAFFVYRATSPGETPYNYFSLLAQSFSEGQITISESGRHLNELIPAEMGRFYVPYAPMPALILIIPSLVSSEIVPQTFYSQLIAAILVYVSILTSHEISSSKKVSIWIGLLTAFGSGFWYLASVGSSWYMGQLVGLTFLTFAIYAKVKKLPTIYIGIFLGCAYLARPHLLLSLPFFLDLNKGLVHQMVLIGIGILPALAFNNWYNFVRFGAFYDKGYELIPGVLDEPWYSKGIFHYSYIPRQLRNMLFSFPAQTNTFPYLIPRLGGMAYWLTTPAILLLIKTRLNRENMQAIVAIALVLLPVLMHGSPGSTQFGFRYALASMPFILYLLTHILKTRLSLLARFLILISIVINAWGVVMIHIVGNFTY